jgi:hypothetical protein
LDIRSSFLAMASEMSFGPVAPLAGGSS